MKLQFRQGIVQHQIDVAGTATFVRKSGNGGNYIDLICDNAPLIFTIAHGTNNYLIQQTKTVTNAWGPFLTPNQTQYLYWDISMLNGSLTFGYTSINPTFGNNAPNNPAVDQHWFDSKTYMMKVWNGSKWIIKLRCFAATYNNSATLVPRTRGTQVALNVPCAAGFILKGKKGQLLKDGDGTFVTTESELLATYTSGENIRFEAMQMYAETTEFIPKFSAVSFVSPGKVKLANCLDVSKQVNGVMTEQYFIGEVGNIISYGLIINDQWNFANNQINKPVFINNAGEITITPPVAGVIQEIGYVYNNNTIYLNIQHPIIM